jgi:hypothetical protein
MAAKTARQGSAFARPTARQAGSALRRPCVPFTFPTLCVLLGRRGIRRRFLFFQDSQVTYAEIGDVELVYLQPAEMHLFH